MNYYCYFQMGMVKREEDSMITSIGLLEGNGTMPRRGIVLSPIVYFLGMRPRSPPSPISSVVETIFFPPRPNPLPTTSSSFKFFNVSCLLPLSLSLFEMMDRFRRLPDLIRISLRHQTASRREARSQALVVGYGVLRDARAGAQYLEVVGWRPKFGRRRRGGG